MDREPTDDSERAMVVQPHGGALRPWQPGQSGNPGGIGAALREVTRLAREASPDVMRRLIAIAGDPDEDIRAVIVAAQAIFDRAFGKPTNKPPPDSPRRMIDLSGLAVEQRQQLAEALGVIRNLTGVAPHGEAVPTDTSRR